MQLEEAIRKSYLVRGLAEEPLAAIIALAQPHTFADGEPLMRQGDACTDIMVIAEGTARILTPQGDKIADIGPSSVVGEISLLDDAPRSATVVSVKGTTVAVLPADKLKVLMQANQDIELGLLRNLAKVLCAHVRRDNVQLEKCYFLLGS